MDLIGSTVTRPAPAAAPAQGEQADVHGLKDLQGSFEGRQVWHISCGDVINRDRCLTVLVDQNKVVLVGPPGETAVLSRGQLGQLRDALREAAEQAER
ncbi:MAG: hypothetical protein ABW224_09630 [Kibdelosporangium sp.]